MDGFPLNLILAVATAAATIFVGFLPSKSISSTFFAKQVGLAIFAWALVAFTSSSQIIQYLLMLAFFCFAAWWHFRRDNSLTGKMWLSLASGLGISLGVMLILEVTPRAYPKDLSQLNETLLLASIYTGGAIIGLPYVCFALAQGTRSGVTQGLIQRYVGILFWLVIVRAGVFLTELLKYRSQQDDYYVYGFNASWNKGGEAHYTFHTFELGLCLLLPLIILITLAFLAQRAAGFSSRINPTRFLVAIMGLGLLAEIGARLLVL